MSISLNVFVKSVRHAWRGLCDIARTEQSFRLQLVVACVVAVCAMAFPLLRLERIVLALLVSGVLILEIVNSILERLADAVHPRIHPTVREMKDMMAGAVLLFSCTAGVIGGILFFPHFFALLCEDLLRCSW